MDTLKQVSLPQGQIQYFDTGTGEPVLFLHGAMVNARLWRKVIPKLQGQYRCIAPHLPIGGHQLPMNPDADLSPHGVVQIILDFLDRLGLKEVTVVGNDTGGAFAQFLMTRAPHRIKRVVLSNCDAFEVFPPKAFAYLVHALKLPGFMELMALSLRIPFSRNLPSTFGNMGIRPVEILDEYLKPMITQKGIRRDLTKLFVAIHPRDTLEAARKLPEFHKPVLVVWGKQDVLFPPPLAERLAAVLPQGQLVWLDGSKTLVPEDQPEKLADLVLAFLQGAPLPSTAPAMHLKPRRA